MKNHRYLKIGAVAIVALLLLVWWYRNFTMNFGSLGWMFFFAIAGLPLYYHSMCKRNVKSLQPFKIGIYDYCFALLGAATLLTLGFACVFTLNNYFYADSRVYRNIDHHAMRFDGVVIDNPESFLLAANSRSAFFDGDQMNGQARITAFSDTAVTLSLNNFTRPIFLNNINDKKRCNKQTLLNGSSLISFKEGDHLQLRQRGDSIYDLCIELANDSVYYWVQTPDSAKILSDERRFIIMGLPLAQAIRHPEIQSSDFIGLHIVRETIYPLVKQKEKLERYAGTHYCLEVQNAVRNADNAITQVRVNDQPWRNVMTAEDTTITIPLDKPFVIGYGVGCTRPAYFTRTHPNAMGKLVLRYLQPVYHYFEQTPDKAFNNVCVATSLNEFMDGIDAMPENILLFDVFNHADNINNIRPKTLSYVSGETAERLQFLYHPDNRSEVYVQAGDYFEGMEAVGNRGVRWLASVENLKDTSPYSPENIRLYIIVFALALSLLLCIGAHRVDTEESAMLNTFTTVEFAAYAATLFLVTFRWFLLWRTSVFLPTENINYFEFEGLFRNTDNGEKLIYCMVGFVAILLFVKLFIRYKALYWSLSMNLSPKALRRCIIGWAVVAAILLTMCLRLKYAGMPWLVITLPVIIYLVNSAIITFCYSGHYMLADQLYSNLSWAAPPAKLFAFSVLNALVITVVLVFIDSGFAILFFTFTLFWLAWLLHEHVTYYLASTVNINRRNWLVLAVFSVMLLLVCFYKDILGEMYYHPYEGALLMAVAGAFVGLGVMYILDWGNRLWRLGWVVGLAVIFSGFSFFFEYYVSNTAQHTAQRIVVHFENPEEAMKNIDDEQNETRFLEAALNHMIIGEYSRRGNDVVLLGDRGEGYFKMQPHSKVGALWNAQLTDLSIVRFVIAEHSPWLPYLAVGFFLLMLVWASRQPLYRRWTRALLMQIPMLLLVQSLLIWMATTRRFIFLGQDFPMLSINSRLTLLFYFSLILIWILVAIFSKVTFTQVYEPTLNPDILNYDPKQRNMFRYAYARREMWMLSIVMALCMVAGYFAPTGSESKEEPALRLTKLMDDFNNTVLKINERLNTYQYDLSTRWPKKANLSDVHDFMKGFNDSLQIDSMFAKSKFQQRIWKNFIDYDCRNNNTKNVIYAHLKNESDSAQKVRRVLQLRVINKFYDQELPQNKDKEWRGNVVALSDSANATTNIVRNHNIWAARLPSDWMAENIERIIVSIPGTIVTGSEDNFTMRSGINAAIVLGQGIHIGEPGVPTELGNTKKHYLARNVMINGHRTMFYPMGASLYWVKSFSDVLMKQRNKQKTEERDEGYNNDVQLTLSPNMNKGLYDILRRSQVKHASVIVANGNGEVWAMPKYDKGLDLNPNDLKQVNRMSDSLSLYGAWGGPDARYAFGNQNLLGLPFGPGSTQKPLVWTAVAANAEFNWNTLRILPYTNEIKDDGDNHYIIKQFNGMNFYENHPFKPLKSPDENGGGTVTLRGYMTHSSNVYNALMGYIGSFSKEELSSASFLDIAQRRDGQSLFAWYDNTNYVSRFPLLSTGGGAFTLNRRLPIADQGNSLFHQSMEDMFFRNTPDALQDTMQDYSNIAPGVLKPVRGFVSVEKSKFEKRHGVSEPEFMEKAIRSTAIGGSQVWYVTPWKMAEAYGRMASLNRDLQLSVIKQSIPYKRFKSLSNSYLKARPEQMKGMSDVFLEKSKIGRGYEGTAKTVGNILKVNIGKENASNTYNGYYIYAKTGTIGPNPSINHHRFGVIISNTDLMTTDESLLSNAKYVIIYFAYSQQKWNSYADAIRLVVNAPEFNRYMNNNN